MKKWVGLLISLLLVIGMVSVSISPHLFRKTMSKETKSEGYRILLIQDEKEKGETDPHMLLILKEIQKQLDEWLKSLNERIENEDITRFEVRFLEILRNILEWIKEKIDAKVEEGERENPKGKKEKGLIRQIHQRNGPFFQIT